jgi:hypothetical protein
MLRLVLNIEICLLFYFFIFIEILFNTGTCLVGSDLHLFIRRINYIFSVDNYRMKFFLLKFLQFIVVIFFSLLMKMY